MSEWFETLSSETPTEASKRFFQWFSEWDNVKQRDFLDSVHAIADRLVGSEDADDLTHDIITALMESSTLYEYISPALAAAKARELAVSFWRRNIDKSNTDIDLGSAAGDASGTMDDAAANAAAARTLLDASDSELKQYVQWGETAAAILRERTKERTKTAPTNEPPRRADPDLAARLALIEQEAKNRVDGTLLELVNRYAELRANIGLPADGFKTLEQARSAALLSTTFGNLQARLRKHDLKELPNDPFVTEARRLSSNFYRRERPKKQGRSLVATATPR